ncbi:MAG: hypothetical protein E7324_03140 [Clostridiales bacterium]|nr:hypothetical protein [Clostridiales bacterium]
MYLAESASLLCQDDDFIGQIMIGPGGMIIEFFQGKNGFKHRIDDIAKGVFSQAAFEKCFSHFFIIKNQNAQGTIWPQNLRVKMLRAGCCNISARRISCLLLSSIAMTLFNVSITISDVDRYIRGAQKNTKKAAS